MPGNDPFVYTSHQIHIQTESGASRLIINVPAGIFEVENLFKILAARVGFPEHFALNWNALSDCLRDLQWVPQREVLLVHADVPALPAAEIYQYISVLAECVSDWKPRESHKLTVMFPESRREEVRRIQEQIDLRQT